MIIRGLTCALILVGGCDQACAYTAAGDRLFPATVLLPQIGPSDEAYATASTLPQTGSGADGRDSMVSITLDKTITEQLSLTMTAAYSVNDEGDGRTGYGWQNFDAALQYLVFSSPEHEFLLSAGVDQNFGDTGAARVGASAQGATTPELFFGKGLGDLPIGLLRPLAIAGYAGIQFADRAPRAGAVQSGLVVEYSFPYLDSKVATLVLPDFLRATTLMCEFAFTNPSADGAANPATALIAPGFNYAGAGFDVGVEALLPATRATGRGIGFIAQIHLSLDYLNPSGIGHPVFQ
jgi:hypothetical protein